MEGRPAAAIMKISKRQSVEFAENQLRKTPHWTRVALPAFGAIVFFGLGLFEMTRGATAPRSMFVTAILGILAAEQWRRLRSATNAGMLAKRLYCPKCKAVMTLTRDERRTGRFACHQCKEGFNVTDSSKDEKGPS